MACLEQAASHSESDKKLLALPPQPPHGNWMQAPVLGGVRHIAVQYFLGRSQATTRRRKQPRPTWRESRSGAASLYTAQGQAVVCNSPPSPENISDISSSARGKPPAGYETKAYEAPDLPQSGNHAQPPGPPASPPPPAGSPPAQVPGEHIKKSICT